MKLIPKGEYVLERVNNVVLSSTPQNVT